jgi:16S rRNA (guanine966-N2)-methyltransferase
MLRIIAGQFRSRLLHTPKVLSTQPTKDRVREAIFSSLGEDIKGQYVLDLFAGSGSLGFEAYSRGAAYVYLNDLHPVAYQTLLKNAAELDIKEVEVTRAHFSLCIKRLAKLSKRVDLIFLDPPYQSDLLKQSFEACQASTIWSTCGIVVLESDKPIHWLDARNFKSLKHYVYGATHVAIGWK